MGLRRMRLQYAMCNKTEKSAKHYPTGYMHMTGVIQVPVVYFGLENYSLQWGCSFIVHKFVSARPFIFKSSDYIWGEDDED